MKALSLWTLTDRLKKLKSYCFEGHLWITLNATKQSHVLLVLSRGISIERHNGKSYKHSCGAARNVINISVLEETSFDSLEIQLSMAKWVIVLALTRAQN